MRKSVSLRMRFFLGAAVLMLASLPALAQFPGDHPDTFQLRMGGIFATFNNETQVSAGGQNGDLISLPNLGLTDDKKTTFRGEGYWNFLGRFYLDFGYVNFTLKGENTITRDIHWNGYVYKVGAQVSGESKSQYIYGAVRYAVLRNEAFRLGLSLGLTYASLSSQLSAAAGVQLPDGTVVQNGATAERKANVPVPMIGFETEIRITNDVTIGGYGRGIGATIDPYSGSWVEWAANINWYFAHNWGVGGAWEYQKIHLTKHANETDAFRYDSRYDGPRIYIIATF